MTTEAEKENAVLQFKEAQSLTELQNLKNKGLEIMQLKNNRWQPLDYINLPLQFVRLYDNDFKLSGIGAY